MCVFCSLVDRPGAFNRWWRGRIFGEWVSMPHICNRCRASRRASHCQTCGWWNEVGVELGGPRPIVSLRYGRYSGPSARLQNGARQQGFNTFCKHTWNLWYTSIHPIITQISITLKIICKVTISFQSLSPLLSPLIPSFQWYLQSVKNLLNLNMKYRNSLSI